MKNHSAQGSMDSGGTKSLISDFTLTLVLTVILVTLISLALNIFFISRQAREDYSKEIQYLRKNIQESLELPLWNIDYENVRKIAGIYLKNAGIKHLAVRDTSGVAIFEGGEMPSEVSRENDLEILYNGESVGRVVLSFQSAPYRRGIFQLLYVQILTGVLVVTALVFTIFFATKGIIKRPLNLLIENIGRIASGDYGITQERFKHIEINAIQDEFSRMVGLIQMREKELKESGERYRSLHDNVPVGLFRTSLNGKIISANQTAMDMFGIKSRAEMYEINIATLYADPSDRRKLLEHVRYSSTNSPVELRFKRRNGTLFWGKVQSREVVDSDGLEPCLDGFLLDITSRKTAESSLKDREEKLIRINRDLNVEILKRKTTETALRNSERRMAQIIDFLPDATFAVDRAGKILFWNRALEKLTGTMSEAMVGKGDYEYAIPFYKERRPILIDLAMEWNNDIAAKYSYVVEKDGIFISETRNVPLIDDESWFWNAACPLMDSQGNIIGAIETIRNISDLKRTEQEVRETGNRFRTLFESAGDAILLLASETIIDCNPRAMEMFDYTRDEMMGLTVQDLFPPKQPDGTSSREEYLRRREATLTESAQAFEWKYRKRSGLLFDASVSLTVVQLESGVYVQAMIRDITEQKRTRELMVQTEKMMSIGGLAAGMAHEINNPLGIILQSAQNTSRRLGTELEKNRVIASELGLDLDALQEYLSRRSIDTYLVTIREAGERAAKIVKSMLDFSRKSESFKAMHSINDILDQVLEMASSDYDLKKKYDFRSVEIIRDYGEIPEIMCTETEIAQVFLNLVKNAAQAMALHGYNGDTPRIILKTEQRESNIVIIVEDNGPGLDAHQQKAVFEPFFTTKAPGEGTGLGLSVSYFIVTTNHRGTLEVESIAGNGTRFIIQLPLR